MYDPDKELKELKEISNMLGWMGDNLGELPLEYQLKYAATVLEFANKVKPIYTASLMYLGEFDS